MITIRLGEEDSKVIPSYYRIMGDNENSSIEIGINSEDGRILNITVFLDKHLVCNVNSEVDRVEQGTVVVETENMGCLSLF